MKSSCSAERRRGLGPGGETRLGLVAAATVARQGSRSLLIRRRGVAEWLTSRAPRRGRREGAGAPAPARSAARSVGLTFFLPSPFFSFVPALRLGRGPRSTRSPRRTCGTARLLRGRRLVRQSRLVSSLPAPTRIALEDLADLDARTPPGLVDRVGPRRSGPLRAHRPRDVVRRPHVAATAAPGGRVGRSPTFALLDLRRRVPARGERVAPAASRRPLSLDAPSLNSAPMGASGAPRGNVWQASAHGSPRPCSALANLALPTPTDGRRSPTNCSHAERPEAAGQFPVGAAGGTHSASTSTDRQARRP